MSLKLSRNPKGVAHNRLAAHPRGVAILLITLTVNKNYLGDMLICVFLNFFRYSIQKRIFVVWASWMWEKQLYVCCAFELYHIYKTISCL